ncbi:MAG: type II toxin-antitoxin system VapC family toxin [Propionibacterium sp.]|jgi:Predicted nucleic acid-binding protein, contains PIN domain|nr:type II toxin-antitoxin system VapC family toxin [Propionibacterium sp.]
MRYLLDTNIVGQLMRAHPVALERLARHGTDRVFISAITEAEICFGLAKRPAAARLHRAVEVLREQVEVLDFTARTALVYGSLRADLESSGMPMSPLDTLIAATALEHRQDDADIVLVTSDHAFSRIPGLIVEDWTVEACGEGQ